MIDKSVHIDYFGLMYSHVLMYFILHNLSCKWSCSLICYNLSNFRSNQCIGQLPCMDSQLENCVLFVFKAKLCLLTNIQMTLYKTFGVEVVVL